MLPAATAKPGYAKETKKARLAVPDHLRGTAASGAGNPPELEAMLKRMTGALAGFVEAMDAAPVSPVQGAAAPATGTAPQNAAETRYPWKKRIVTTTFWIGEQPSKNNPVPNHISAWDRNWAKAFGGTDNPNRRLRVNYRPAAFIPKLNPFYIALPYNDLTNTGHKREASKVIPWFKEAYEGPGVSVLKGRWLAIRHKGRVAYAQWEDCGPFRTDHAQYVFGNARPLPNLNKGAGLDVSPAVRDYLGMKDSDVTDWRFVELDEVPNGPWKHYGEDNPFVQRRRADSKKIALEAQIRPGGG